MTDRTLDQQCTVTRPGIAAIASALIVEILVSLLQHPLGALAPAPAHPTDDRDDHPLGIIPHQIRGFLSTFDNKVIRGNSYDCCSACSNKIVDTYKADGWDFVQKAMNEKYYVEELSGLAEVNSGRFWKFLYFAYPLQVQREAEKAMANVEWSDDGDEADDGDGELI